VNSNIQDKNMTATLTKTTILLAIILTIAGTTITATTPTAQAQNQTISYQLLNHPDGTITYTLNVAIPENLQEYYQEKTHKLTTPTDFPNFVTPYTLKPIADKLWEIYNNPEDFANGALMLVHQITYQETTPAKYPVETMTNGQGDCDLFSFIAASIMKAGNLDVILLYYENQAHMNIGVHLPTPPKDTRDNAYYFTHDETKYYVAESTGGNWKDGWRVGECPTDLKQVSAVILTLENAEQIAPGQVSASFTALEPSTLSLEVTPSISLQNNAITIHGQLAPEMPNENVTLYTSVNNSPWIIIGTTLTQPDGHFEYTWTTGPAGSQSIRASWPGNELYTGAISPTRGATVIPLFLGALVGVAILAAVIGVAAVLMARHTQQLPTIEPYQNQI
jgi:hypothetical protein